MITNKVHGQGKGNFLLFAILHLICCGIPLLLLSGISIGFLALSWPVIGWALAILGVIGFVWYLKRGCPTCPRNEGGRMLDQ
jgi:hypothetical protein